MQKGEESSRGFQFTWPTQPQGSRKLSYSVTGRGGPHHGMGHLERLFAATSRQPESSKLKSYGNLVFHSTENPEVVEFRQQMVWSGAQCCHQGIESCLSLMAAIPNLGLCSQEGFPLGQQKLLQQFQTGLPEMIVCKRRGHRKKRILFLRKSFSDALSWISHFFGKTCHMSILIYHDWFRNHNLPVGARTRVSFLLKHMAVGRRGGHVSWSEVQSRRGMWNEPPQHVPHSLHMAEAFFSRGDETPFIWVKGVHKWEIWVDKG